MIVVLLLWVLMYTILLHATQQGSVSDRIGVPTLDKSTALDTCIWQHSHEWCCTSYEVQWNETERVRLDDMSKSNFQ